MKKAFYLILFLTVLCILTSKNSEAIIAVQIWNQTLDNQTNIGWYDNTIDSLDNSIQAGDISNTDGIIGKYNSEGELQWNITGAGYYFRGITADLEDNFYACGRSSGDPFLIKYNSTGNNLWNISLQNGTSGHFGKVAVDTDNNVIVAGYDTTGSWDYAWVLKYNSTGTQLWNLTFPNSKEAQAVAVDTDLNNNIFVGFTYGTFFVDMEIWLVKYDSSGTQLWNFTYSYPSIALNYPSSVVVDSDDDVIMASYVMNDAFEGYSLFLKFNNTGTQIWNRTYEEAGDAASNEIAVDSEDNIIATISVNNGVPVRVLKYDPDGFLLYNASFGRGIYDDFPGIEADSNNYIIMSGDGNYNDTHLNLYVVKWDDGTPKWKNFYKVGKTTYLYNESDLNSVSGLVLDSKCSLIEWNQAVNVSHADLTNYASLGNGYASLNTLYLDSTFNSSANVSINVTNCDYWNIYYSSSYVSSLSELRNTGRIVGTKTGGCTEYCSNPICVNNQLNYTVTSFSSTGGESVPAPITGGGGRTAGRSYLFSTQTAMNITPKQEIKCEESWLCNEWSECTEGKQTRTCEDWNKCGTEETKPAIEQPCEYADNHKQEEKLDNRILPEYSALSSSGQMPSTQTSSAKRIKKILGSGIAIILLFIGIIIYVVYRKRKKNK